MGAALSSHGFDDPQHRQLLAEYLAHSQKNLDECAQIFRGAVGNRFGGDSDDDDSEFVARVRCASASEDTPSCHGAAASSQAPSGYPRNLDFQRFEEVFSMLVTDAEPHFEFFLDEAAQTACAHQVFCAMALLMRADVYDKVMFLLRLYADPVGQLSAERKRLVIQDFLLALQLALNLADEVSSDVLSAVEKTFWTEDESKSMSVREVYDVCFTSALVSGYLHDVQELVQEFTTNYERDLQRSQSVHTLPAPASGAAEAASSAGPTDKAKTLSRTASTFALSQNSLLWTLRARDYQHFWRQQHVELRSGTSCVHALRAMAEACVHEVVVFDAPAGHAVSDVRVYSGLVSTGTFLRFFLHFLPADPTRFHIERAIRKLGMATLRDVLQFCGKRPRFQCIDDDEAFFNVLLRFACGAESIAVLADTPEHPHSFLFGSLTALSLLTWLEEDMTLLNGKEAHALRTFPSFFYTPVSVPASKTGVCDGFAAMRERKLTAIAVAFIDRASASKLLGRQAFRDFFLQSYAVWAGAMENSADVSPLLCTLSDVSSALLEPPCVSPESSIACAVRAMVDANATRAFIRSASTDDSAPATTLGVVRATDILLLLLREQHGAGVSRRAGDRKSGVS